MNVDFHRPRVSGHEHGLADRLEVIPQGIHVQQLAGPRLEEVHRLVAETLVRVSNQDRPPGRGPGRDVGRFGRTTDHEQQGSLEEPIQALSTGVDHARLAKNGQERWGPGDRLLRGIEGHGQDGLDVVPLLRGRDSCGRRLPDHGQDRSLDRLRNRSIGGSRARIERIREVEPVESRLALECLGDPAEDLAGNDPGIATGAHEGPERSGGRDALRSGTLTGTLGFDQCRFHRCQHVGTRIAIGYREDIQRVDLVDMRLEIRNRSPECPEKASPIAGTPCHQATSVPLSASSELPMALCVGAPGGWVPGDASKPPIRMRRSSTSRPRARRIPYRTAESTWRATSATGRPIVTRSVR